MDRLDANQFPLAPHQKETISAPDKADWDADRLGLFLGGAAISEFYFFGQPQFDYPADFLSDPRPERVCNPETVKIDSRLMMIHYDMPEEDTWALTREQFLVFDCMCWEVKGEEPTYSAKSAGVPF